MHHRLLTLQPHIIIIPQPLIPPLLVQYLPLIRHSPIHRAIVAFVVAGERYVLFCVFVGEDFSVID